MISRPRPKKSASKRLGRPPKQGAARHTIRVTDAVWREYERIGDGDATRGIERAAPWLKHIEGLEGWTRERMADED